MDLEGFGVWEGFRKDLGRILKGFWRNLEAQGGLNGHENRYISKKIQARPPGSPKEGFPPRSPPEEGLGRVLDRFGLDFGVGLEGFGMNFGRKKKNASWEQHRIKNGFYSKMT